METDEYSLRAYDRRESIGSGSYGDVFRYDLRERFNGQYGSFPVSMAVKRIVRSSKSREPDMCNLIAHQNIVRFFGEEIVDELIHIKMELARCNLKLFQADKCEEPISKDVFFHFAMQIMKGVKYLHKQDISHRDIKPQNVLVFWSGEMMFKRDGMLHVVLKLCDFGLSRIILENQSASITAVGTQASLLLELKHSWLLR